MDYATFENGNGYKVKMFTEHLISGTGVESQRDFFMHNEGTGKQKHIEQVYENGKLTTKVNIPDCSSEIDLEKEKMNARDTKTINAKGTESYVDKVTSQLGGLGLPPIGNTKNGYGRRIVSEDENVSPADADLFNLQKKFQKKRT